ncbi:MAG: GGDEF domain-containing protein [Pseudomonadota bacterium]
MSAVPAPPVLSEPRAPRPMADVIDHVADLTGNRDRERVDVVFVQALVALLRAQEVAVWRLVGEGHEWRWFLCARLRAGEVTPASDAPWTPFADLVVPDAVPWRGECLRAQAQILAPRRGADQPVVNVFPLPGEAVAQTVVEIATDRPLTPAKLQTVQALMRVYGNIQSLLDYSQRDTLTGLLNRKTFDETFMRTALPGGMLLQANPAALPAGEPVPGAGGAEADGEARKPAPAQQAWLGVIDIDHFKRVNDTYGHLIGDEVLLLVARILRSTFRFQDQLYRFGGEEFVVMLRCHNEADAMLAFERFRQNMAAYPFPQIGHVTASVGFTQVMPEDSPGAAFDRADRAVYHAKQNGRNRVVSHAELVRAGELEAATKVGDVELF